MNMPQRQTPKPRKPLKQRKGLISFLDLGSGPNAEHGWHLAEHRKNRARKGRFVSVDLDRRILLDKQGRIFDQHHHEFRQTNAFNYLAKAKPNSVKVVNDEGMIDSVIAKKLSDSSQSKISDTILGVRKDVENFAKQPIRVLVPNGRIFVTVHSLYKNIILQELEKAGFENISVRQLSENEIKKSHSDYFHAVLSVFGIAPNGSALEFLSPYNISARKPAKRND